MPPSAASDRVVPESDLPEAWRQWTRRALHSPVPGGRVDRGIGHLAPENLRLRHELAPAFPRGELDPRESAPDRVRAAYEPVLVRQIRDESRAVRPAADPKLAAVGA